MFYRLFVKVGDYSSGTIALTLNFAGGSIEGICRITDYLTTTTVNAQVLTDLGSSEPTKDWYESVWSDTRRLSYLIIII